MSHADFYRFEDVQYASSLDEFDNPLGDGQLKVELRTFKTLRNTPKGVWLIPVYGQYMCADSPRFMRLNCTKQFACPTVETARESFIARKRKQARIYRARMERALRAIAIIEAAGLLPVRHHAWSAGDGLCDAGGMNRFVR